MTPLFLKKVKLYKASTYSANNVTEGLWSGFKIEKNLRISVRHGFGNTRLTGQNEGSAFIAARERERRGGLPISRVSRVDPMIGGHQ